MKVVTNIKPATSPSPFVPLGTLGKNLGNGLVKTWEMKGKHGLGLPRCPWRCLSSSSDSDTSARTGELPEGLDRAIMLLYPALEFISCAMASSRCGWVVISGSVCLSVEKFSLTF